MDLHKPKPIRNWREFLKEYAIIVLGVATALAAEQAVEWLHWRHRIADARAALLLELRDINAPQAYTRVAAVRCFDRQLNVLQDAIEAGKTRAEITSLIAAYKLPIRTWQTTSWDALLASDVASHVSPQQLIQWSLQYKQLPNLSAVGRQEASDRAALELDRRSGQNLSPAEADTTLATIKRLRMDNRVMWGQGLGLLANMKLNGIEMPPAQQRRILAELSALYSGCVNTPSVPNGAFTNTDQTFSLRERGGIAGQVVDDRRPYSVTGKP